MILCQLLPLCQYLNKSNRACSLIRQNGLVNCTNSVDDDVIHRCFTSGSISIQFQNVPNLKSYLSKISL